MNATTDPAGQGEVAITAENQELKAFMRIKGDDGDICAVRKGSIHASASGFPWAVGEEFVRDDPNIHAPHLSVA